MKIFFVALLWLLSLVFLVVSAFLVYGRLFFYAVLSYVLAYCCLYVGQNILRSRDAALATFQVGFFVLPVGVVFCLFGLWLVGLSLLIVGMLTTAGAARFMKREAADAPKLSETEVQSQLGAKDGEPRNKKRSWLAVSRAWLAILLFVLFGGVALGVGALFVLGLFAGPGTVGGEFVSIHSAAIIVFCGAIAFIIRRTRISSE